jgi:signal transduction histidine kinase
MRKPEPYEVLQQAFPGIPPEEAQQLIASGKARSFPTGAVVYEEGAVETRFYIILKGEVRVSKQITSEEVRLLNHLYTGDFFGEMALIHDTPRTATVTAVIPTEVLEINKDAFDQALQRSSTIAIAMIREVSRRLRENDEMAISDLQIKASELSQAYQQLAEQEFGRRQFLTTIAHELRTPLTTAGGFLQMARQGLVDEKRPVDKAILTTALGTVSENLQHIVTLVNDILFLQEMDLIFSEFQPINVGKLVMSTIEHYRLKAEQNGVRLHLDIPPYVPEIPGDQKSLERALVAILDNAIKFSPDGGDVDVKVVYDGDEVCVSVKDSGVGIPEDIMARIFDRLFHTDYIGGHLFGGIGLGLSIAREVVQQHGGKITVKSFPPGSAEGKGSTFTVHLVV